MTTGRGRCRGPWRLALAGLAAATAACGPGRAVVLPPPPPVVHLTVAEHNIVVVEPVPRGRVVFSVANTGSVPHRVSLIPLPEDFPPVAELAKSPGGTVVDVLAATATADPGGDALFAVDLPPGRYGLACFEVADDGETHSQKGEVAEFRVP